METLEWVQGAGSSALEGITIGRGDGPSGEPSSLNVIVITNATITDTLSILFVIDATISENEVALSPHNNSLD